LFELFRFSCLRYDWRLSFVSLKNGSTRGNTVSKMEREQIWIPSLVFGNSVKDAFIRVDELSALIVKQQHKPHTILNYDLNENDIYVGSMNPLIFERIYELKLRCEFELHFYPFDIQKCHIQVIFLFVL